MVNLLSVPAFRKIVDELDEGYDLLRYHLLNAGKVLNGLKEGSSDLPSELREQLASVRDEIEAAEKQNTLLHERLTHFLVSEESDQAAEEGVV